MFTYKTLDNTSIDVIHHAFVAAFSDYQVKMDMPLERLEQMLVRRGFRPELSVGAFKDDTLVGFALNGIRLWNGKQTAYDTATGVLPEYRRQGLTGNIFSRVKELLKANHVAQYLLEVLISNTPAVQLYQKQGFETQREFSCYKLNKNQFIPREKHRIEPCSKLDLNKVRYFFDFMPSWQNSAASVNAVHPSFYYSIVRVNDTIAGYGIIEKKTGDIPQIAVRKDCRRNGIASSILADLVENAETEKISILNIERQSKPVESFLNKAGFEYYVGQYEMLLNLKNYSLPG